MNPRVEYEMTQEDLSELMNACKPTPCMMIGGHTSTTPQENANLAWAKLGKKMGFDSMSVRPSDRGKRFFTAVPSETESQRTFRLQKEDEEKREIRKTQLISEIAEKQVELNKLQQESQNA